MKKIISFAIVCLVFSCKKENQHPETYTSYELNGMEWKSKNAIQFLDSYTYQVVEVPLKYYLYKNLGAEKAHQIDSIYQKHKGERVLEIKFSHLDEEDILKTEFNTRETYKDAVEYMAFAIRNDFKAVTASNDTIKCIGVHFERNFNVAPYKKLLLYFNGIPQDENIQLVYHDRLFGNGTVKFNLKEQPIQL